MSLSKNQAVKVATKYGLSLSDAATLHEIADTAEEAEALAKEFTGTNQLSRDDIKSMTPEQIAKAQDDGRLDDVLGRRK